MKVHLGATSHRLIVFDSMGCIGLSALSGGTAVAERNPGR